MATPGLHVVTPATVADAYGLLRAAIASDDPVVFLEPKRLYWSKASWNPDEPPAVEPIGRAVVRRPGRSATLITYGPSRARLPGGGRGGARRRAGTSRSSTCARWCRSTTRRSAASVRRTGRAVVVHESAGFGGPGGGDRGPGHRALLPPPGGAGAAGRRVRHPVSAADAGAAPPARRGPDPGRRGPAAVGGGRADGAGARSSRCPTSARG